MELNRIEKRILHSKTPPQQSVTYTYNPPYKNIEGGGGLISFKELQGWVKQKLEGGSEIPWITIVRVHTLIEDTLPEDM